MVVEFLGDAFVLHHEVLPEGCAAELHMQLAFAHKDLAGIAADDFPHHFGPSLGDAVLQQRRFQALLPQEGQQDIANRGSFPTASYKGRIILRSQH